MKWYKTKDIEPKELQMVIGKWDFHLPLPLLQPVYKSFSRQTEGRFISGNYWFTIVADPTTVGGGIISEVLTRPPDEWAKLGYISNEKEIKKNKPISRFELMEI